ncbi:hypothetical protein BSKO_10352 [Bryopsis sp. KO-2023]|nr:hypothetical protein BSKO_10352 [Bryopsis sp. KO-2023]
MPGGRGLSAEVCEKIVERVFSWDLKPKNFRVFARDLLVVVCGVRPAVFCDEVHFRCKDWTKIREFLREVGVVSGVAVSCLLYKDPSQWDVKGSDGGVLYLVNRELLKQNCAAQEGRRWPIYLAQKPSSRDVRTVLDNESATKFVLSMVEEVLTALENEPNDRLVDLSCIPGASQSLPMLNGWLLEYPLIYAYGIDHLNPELGGVVGCMDEKSVIRCCLECKLVGISQHRMAVSPVPQLFSFTVPEGVLDEDELLAAVRDRLKSRIGGVEGVWGELEVVRERPGRVAWAV